MHPSTQPDDVGLEASVGEADVLRRDEVREDVEAGVEGVEGRVVHELAEARDIVGRLGVRQSSPQQRAHQRQVGLGPHGGAPVVAPLISVNSFSLLEATGELKVCVLEPERNLSAALEM